MYTGGPHIIRQHGRNRKSYYEHFLLFQIEYREVKKAVLCETILCTIGGMIIFLKSYF